ncbi:hypothetical protein ES705_05279 [subsurface metagenome]|nr:hypothetical protein [Clostridia bacterium]
MKKQTKIGCGILSGSFLIFVILLAIILSSPTEKRKDYIEVRVSPRTGINIRTGPGTNYPKDGRLVRKDNLYVLEEKDGWIRFRITPKDVGWSGWVRKDLTVSKDEWDSAIRRENLKIVEENIALLKKEGLLIEIETDPPQALVNSTIWYGLDQQSKYNIAETMASYCGLNTNSSASISIRDCLSLKLLARYSDTFGFKEHQ